MKNILQWDIFTMLFYASLYLSIQGFFKYKFARVSLRSWKCKWENFSVKCAGFKCLYLVKCRRYAQSLKAKLLFRYFHEQTTIRNLKFRSLLFIHRVSKQVHPSQMPAYIFAHPFKQFANTNLCFHGPNSLKVN